MSVHMTCQGLYKPKPVSVWPHDVSVRPNDVSLCPYYVLVCPSDVSVLLHVYVTIMGL